MATNNDKEWGMSYITAQDAEIAAAWLAGVEGYTMDWVARCAAHNGTEWHDLCYRGIKARLFALRGIADDGTSVTHERIEAEARSDWEHVEAQIKSRDSRLLPGWSGAARGHRVFAAHDDDGA